MVSLVFTDSLVFVGVKTPSLKLIPVNGKLPLPLDGKSMHDVLVENHDQIRQAYFRYRTDAAESEAPVALTVAFPVSSYHQKVQNADREKVIKFLNSNESGFDLIYSDDLAVSFLHGITPSNGFTTKGCIVMEALDDFVNLYYHKTKPPKGKKTQQQVVRLEEVGFAPGQRRLMYEMESALTQAGIAIDDELKEEIRQQLRRPTNGLGPRYVVRRGEGDINIQTEISLTPRKYQDAITTNRNSFQDHLSLEALEEQEVHRVVMLGSYLNNQVLKEYFENDLNIGPKLWALPPNGTHTEVHTILRGLEKRTQEYLEELRRKAEEERKRREEEERRKKEEEAKRLREQLEAERSALENRENLFREIKAYCVDPEQFETYKKKFIPRGRELGIPDEVVIWNLTDTLSAIKIEHLRSKSRELLEDLSKFGKTPSLTPTEKEPVSTAAPAPEETFVHETAPVNDLPEEPEAPEPVIENTWEPVEDEPVAVAAPVEPPRPEPEPVISAPVVAAPSQPESRVVEAPVAQVQVEVADVAVKEAPLPVQEEMPSSGIRDEYEIKGVLNDPEFTCIKAVPINGKDEMVIRMVKSPEMMQSVRWENFQRLHRYETAYFGDDQVSEIRSVQEGKYFIRPFIEGTKLKDYVGKIGLDKKSSYDKLSVQDNLLILEVIQAVEDLEVPHFYLNEDHILVISKRKWNLEKTLNIKFIGLSSKECNKKDSLEKAHNVFERLLAPGVYNEFRKKHNI